MDVEGAEPQVLAGLGYPPSILLFEFVPALLREMGHDPSGFLSSLQIQGYMLELVDPDTGQRTLRTPGEILAFAEGINANCNILARLPHEDRLSLDSPELAAVATEESAARP
jgi:hypothetical protein